MSANEKIFPAPDTLNNQPYGKYVLTNLAAKRAKQIKDGAPPLVRIDSSHPLSIALAEIAAGKIKPILGADAQQAELEDDYSNLDDISLNDVELLLPGVDDEDGDADIDVDLDSLDLDPSDEEDAENDDADDDDNKSKKSAKEASISDLLGDDDDDDDSSEDNDNISLDDLAKQESADEDEDEDN